MLFKTPAGLTGTYTNLTQIGFGLNSEGKLKIDDAKLDSAISSNIDALSTLFRAVGSSSNSQIAYLASTSKTKASSSAGYSVVITQAATQHTMLGEMAQTSPLTQQEVLTFNGSLFGNNSYDIILDAGMTQQQAVDKINADAKLKDLVTASIVGGKLQLNAKKYGLPGAFTVTSNRAAAADQTGLGTATITTQAADVAGTINGETASGSGQLLTGASGNATTDGLQILYTGTATGSIGSLVFTKGLAPTFSDAVASFTDATNGLLTATDKGITDQIEGINKSIEDLQARLADKQISLRMRFSRMEQAISQLQGQQARLASIRVQG
jgi:flagellar hook-associated protein 2